MFSTRVFSIQLTKRDNCGTGQCGQCEGHCTSDSDCSGTLKCWKRKYTHSNVLGCEMGGGGDQVDTNYCYEPCPIVSSGENGKPINRCKNTLVSFDFGAQKPLTNKACTASNICGECEGGQSGCSISANGVVVGCAAGKKCWRRNYKHSNVPGCAASANDDNEMAESYCYTPCPTIKTSDGDIHLTDYHHGCKNNLKHVLKSSSGCSVTDGTIDIWVNAAIAANENYDILSSSSMQLGGDINMPSHDIIAKDIVTSGLTVTGSVAGSNIISADNIAPNAVTTASIGVGQVNSACIKNGAVTTTAIRSNAVTSGTIKDGAVTTAKIATNAVTPATLQNSGHFTMGRVKADYISAGNPSWNSNWRVNLDQNVWIHHTLEVDGKSDLQGGLKVWGKSELTGGLKVTGYWGTTSSAGYKSIWSYHAGASWGGQKFYHGVSNYDYVYIYGDRAARGVTAEFRGYIAVEYGMYGQSDRRIKTNIVDLNDISSLQKVLQIPARNYQYKDKLKRGFGNVTGFIAQEVNETFPEACREGTEFIPYIDDVYSVISFKDNKVIIPTIQGDEKLVPDDVIEAMIHIDDESGPIRQFSVTDVTTDTVVLECIECKEGDDKADRILIRSKQIHDFLHIDKQRIFTLHHGAIQEIHREQEVLIARVASLEETIAKLSERLAALDGQS